MEPREFHTDQEIAVNMAGRLGIVILLLIVGGGACLYMAWQQESWSWAICGTVFLSPLLLFVPMIHWQFTHCIRVSADGIDVPAGWYSRTGWFPSQHIPYGEIRRYGTYSEETTRSQQKWGVGDTQKWLVIETVAGSYYCVFVSIYADSKKMLDLLSRQGLRTASVEKNEFLGTYAFVEEESK